MGTFEVSVLAHIALRNLLWPVTANQLHVLTNKHAGSCFAIWPVNCIWNGGTLYHGVNTFCGEVFSKRLLLHLQKLLWYHGVLHGYTSLPWNGLPWLPFVHLTDCLLQNNNRKGWCFNKFKRCEEKEYTYKVQTIRKENYFDKSVAKTLELVVLCV